jgi:uncharacterized protein (DUF952 family)
VILHLTSRDEWLQAEKAGEYRAPSLQTEGFIHCSTEKQVARVANSFYISRHGLVLLVIEPARLHPDLRWEPPAHPNPPADLPPSDDLFPHIYGPINIDAVVRIVDYEPNAEGVFPPPRFD